jgi:hypothetical protein
VARVRGEDEEDGGARDGELYALLVAAEQA